MMLTETAIAAMSREDAHAEAVAKRNGWMHESDVYGFRLVSRNIQTGAIQESHIYYSRAEAYAALLAKHPRKDWPWVHESIERCRTVSARRIAA